MLKTPSTNTPISGDVPLWFDGLSDIPRLIEVQREDCPDCERDEGWNAALEVAAGITREAIDAYQSHSTGDAGPETDGSAWVWRWIERAAFDDKLSKAECIDVLLHYPGAPWNLGRWDVDHKPYAEAFYKAFPKAALNQQQETGDVCV